MEEWIPYMASLNSVMNSGGYEGLIFKEVTEYLRTNPEGITVKDLIDYLLIDDGFSVEEKNIEQTIRADISNSEPRISDPVSVKGVIRDILRAYEYNPENFVRKNLDGSDGIDDVVDALYKSRDYGIRLVDNEGDYRIVPERFNEGNNFLKKTATAIHLFEKYWTPIGAEYMGLNLVVIGAEGCS